MIKDADEQPNEEIEQPNEDIIIHRSRSGRVPSA